MGFNSGFKGLSTIITVVVVSRF